MKVTKTTKVTKNILFTIFVLSVFSCGVETVKKEVPVDENVTSSVQTVAAEAPTTESITLVTNERDLPNCTKSNKNQLVYLKDTGLFKSCETDGWAEISIKGANGKDGVAGVAGVNGTNGVDGADGIAGVDGVDGIAGVDGINGINGVDGIDGIDSDITSLITLTSDGNGVAITDTNEVQLVVAGPSADIANVSIQRTWDQYTKNVIFTVTRPSTNVRYISMKVSVGKTEFTAGFPGLVSGTWGCKVVFPETTGKTTLLSSQLPAAFKSVIYGTLYDLNGSYATSNGIITVYWTLLTYLQNGANSIQTFQLLW